MDQTDGLPAALARQATPETVYGVESVRIDPATSESEGEVTWSSCSTLPYEELNDLLTPFYSEALPEADGWGNRLEFCVALSNPDALQYVIGVRSPGRDGVFEASRYIRGPFAATEYDRDVVWIDGAFVTWPLRDN